MTRTPSRQVVDQILDAAQAVLADEGPDAVTSTAVAAAADVSVQTIYNRFGTLDALLDDLTTRGFRRLRAHLLEGAFQPLVAIDDPLVLVVEVLRRHRDFSVAEPRLHRFLFDGPKPWWSHRTAEAAGEPFALLATVVGRAIDAGLLLPGQPDDVAGRLWAAAHGAMWLDATASFDATVATMIRGLRPSAQLR